MPVLLCSAQLAHSAAAQPTGLWHLCPTPVTHAAGEHPAGAVLSCASAAATAMLMSASNICKRYAARKVCPLTGLVMMHTTVGIQCGAQQQWTLGQEVGQEVGSRILKSDKPGKHSKHSWA